MSDRRFTFIFGTVELTESEIWPDKDGPKNPTAEDVANVVTGNHYRYDSGSLIREWNLTPSLEVFCPDDKSHTVVFG